MEIIFAKKVSEDIAFFKKSGKYNHIRKRIDALILSIKETPYLGIGIPEQLRYELTGCWSRRINEEDRIVYRVSEGTKIVKILSIRGHYQNK